MAAHALLPMLWLDRVGAAEVVDTPTRPSERALPTPGPRRDLPQDRLVVPPAFDEQPGPLVDGAAVKVEAVAFEGNRAISNAELQNLAQPYVGRWLRAAEIEELRLRITRYYIGKGYISSGAILGTDPYRSGVLRIRIVEGTLEHIRVSGLGRLRESYVTERLSRPGEAFNVYPLQERFQRLLADPMFDSIKARVLPGSAPGNAVLDVQAARSQPYGLMLFANNHRSPSIGSEAYGASGQLKNLTGLGDTMHLHYQDGRGGPRYGTSWGMPVNRHDTAVEVRYDEGRSALIEEPFNSIDIESRFTSLEIGLQHPFIAGVDRRASLGVSWGERESRSTIAGEPFSFVPGEIDGRTRVWVWRSSLEGWRRWEQAALSGRVTHSSGHNNIRQEQATASTPDRRFAVWLGQIQYAHRLSAGGAQAVLRGLIQETSGRLVPLERVSIGGVATVRGYRENELVRDKGHAASVEIHLPLVVAGGTQRALKLVAFADHGAARNQNERTEHLHSVGVGLEGRYAAVGGEIYFARRLAEPNAPGSNLQDKGVHVQVRYHIL